jgi:hypothetical protein
LTIKLNVQCCIISLQLLLNHHIEAPILCWQSIKCNMEFQAKSSPSRLCGIAERHVSFHMKPATKEIKEIFVSK